jgi:DNA mismatch endonuclease, patch repair protein
VSYAVPDLRRCSIDIAFPRQKVAVFVDGCFWHGCAEHGTHPKSNADRWAAKLLANRARDRRVDEHLLERGWVVLRIWEHEDAEAACMHVLEVLSARAEAH